MVFSNCNKTPLCSASSSPPRRQREKGLRISLRFSAGSDDAGDDNDNNDDTMRFLRRDAVLPLFSCYHCWDVFPLCLLEWKLDPLLVSPRSFVSSDVCARGASRDWWKNEDFYLRRRKQIPFKIFISVGIMLRGSLVRLSDGASEIISIRALFRFPE